MYYAYYSIHNSENLFAFFADLSKAFDAVNHNIMLRKLQHIGVRGKISNWFKPYLTDRKQYVAVDGIPYESNLGPLMFLLHLIDLS